MEFKLTMGLTSIISGRQVGVGASNYTGTDAYRQGSSEVLSLVEERERG